MLGKKGARRKSWRWSSFCRKSSVGWSVGLSAGERVDNDEWLTGLVTPQRVQVETRKRTAPMENRI